MRKRVFVLMVAGTWSSAGCDPRPGPEDVRDLHCASVAEPRAAELCVRMERALEFKRGGHAVLFGFPAWRCTERTFEQLVCVEPRVDLATVKAAGVGLPLSDFTACLGNLEYAIEDAARPKSERTSPFDIDCGSVAAE